MGNLNGKRSKRKFVALAGGVGGAKLADGLAQLLGDRLVVVVNTGDDFEHLGLHISPDLDTVMYTLAGIADKERGWGLRDLEIHGASIPARRPGLVSPSSLSD
jgi:LPPG:FO 2-phospho-L-lactate transferase